MSLPAMPEVRVPSADGAADARAVVRNYHQRTKHHLQRYAAGPETLDWDAQPDPFRRYAGAPLLALPLQADDVAVPWADLFRPGAVTPRPLALHTLSLLLELSFALSAWKQSGPDRWAVRCTPSSGNLHPTEAYVLTRDTDGLPDALYHYAAREHALELRCKLAAPPAQGACSPATVATQRLRARAFVGLSSIHWREAWKYGERAFRYCQLDLGHALGALRYAAAVLGWTLKVWPAAGPDLAGLLGLDRDGDFGSAEREDPELLVELLAAPPEDRWRAESEADDDPLAWTRHGAWQGRANRLDPRPMYRWPAIHAVARATPPSAQAEFAADATCPARCPRHEAACGSLERAAIGQTRPRPPLPGLLWARPAAALIRNRRSAQRFDRRAVQSAGSFFRMLAALMPEAGLPWEAWPHAPRVHPIVFAHRVEGLRPGAYALPRTPDAALALQAALSPDLAWTAVDDAPPELPLRLLAPNPALAGTLRTLCCHQALASDATAAFAFLAEFDTVVDATPWRYRELLQEAGLLGQVLYLQAEAEGMRGTGIGCFFDDALHDLLGLRDTRFQAVYAFTVGHALTDDRVASEPPYAAARPAVRTGENPA